jgi:L-aspartate oxidase
VHGANRLASNSLLEGLVFGARAADAMTQPPAAGRLAGEVREAAPEDISTAASGLPSEPAVRALMWADVGLLRDRDGLRRAAATLDAFDAVLRRSPNETWPPAAWRLANLVTVGALMARAALRRTESRGGHYRADFAARDDVHWSAHIAERIRN